MKTLLALSRGSGFFGKRHVETPHRFHDEQLEPVKHTLGKDTDIVEAIKEVAEEYPPETVGAILVHNYGTVGAISESGCYSDTPICIAAHVIRESPSSLREVQNNFDNELELYLFAGSVRTGRVFYNPMVENFQIVIAPILGRAASPPGKMEGALEPPVKKEYDIAFWSVLSYKKRPHVVLETAHRVAKELDRTLDVYLAGHPRDGPYHELLTELIESEYYGNLNIDFNPSEPTRELVQNIQKSKVGFLPLIKRTETTCYAAWEGVSLGIPIIGSDWAGIGEAIRSSDHPHSTAVPVHKSSSYRQSIPDSVEREFPELVADVMEGQQPNNRLKIDLETAKNAILSALTEETEYEETVEVPEQVHPSTTIKAMSDIAHGRLTTDPDIDDAVVSRRIGDAVKTRRGYGLLRDPIRYNSHAQQRSPDPTLSTIDELSNHHSNEESIVDLPDDIDSVEQAASTRSRPSATTDGGVTALATANDEMSLLPVDVMESLPPVPTTEPQQEATKEGEEQDQTEDDEKHDNNERSTTKTSPVGLSFGTTDGSYLALSPDVDPMKGEVKPGISAETITNGMALEGASEDEVRIDVTAQTDQKLKSVTTKSEGLRLSEAKRFVADAVKFDCNWITFNIDGRGEITLHITSPHEVTAHIDIKMDLIDSEQQAIAISKSTVSAALNDIENLTLIDASPKEPNEHFEEETHPAVEEYDDHLYISLEVTVLINTAATAGNAKTRTRHELRSLLDLSPSQITVANAEPVKTDR